jgi:hypothetical protein
MCQETAFLRLIYCIEVSLVLHAILLTQVWGGAVHPVFLHGPMSVRLVARDANTSLKPADEAQAPQTDTRHRDTLSETVHAYHAARKLTRMPEMTGQPPDAIEIGQGLSGEVTFRLSINRMGIITRIQSVQSSLPRDIEGKLAMQLYRNEYRPGEIDGVAVDSEMIVDLKLDAGGWLTDRIPVLGQGQ